MPDEAMKSKVLLLGDGAVGKTSLIRRFVVDQFSDDYLTREDTRRSMEEYWMPMVWRLVGRIPMVIVGNKVDLLQEERMAAHEYAYYLEGKYSSPSIMTR